MLEIAVSFRDIHPDRSHEVFMNGVWMAIRLSFQLVSPRGLVSPEKVLENLSELVRRLLGKHARHTRNGGNTVRAWVLRTGIARSNRLGPRSTA